MGSCIICGADTEGEVCSVHEEDVVFEFTGTRPEQLTPGRFYRGTVDGIAEFGVFVDIGDRVTGLLHQSELDQRLESLDWERGHVIFVQVTDVHDNGNIDLSWSIRQAENEFRGALVDDPNGDRTPEGNDEFDRNDEDEDTKPTQTPAPAPDTQEPRKSEDVEESRPEPSRVTVETLSDRIGDRIRLEGEVVSVRQTGGPTVFTVRDETATVDCAAFKEAGVRAYPEIEVGEYVRLDGVVERHQNELQVETETLSVLDEDGQATVEERLEQALIDQTRPEDIDLLGDLPGVSGVSDQIRDAAETIRRAVVESRPVIVRHDATADGYLAGAAIERAVLPLVRDEHAKSDAEYHYFDRRPLDDRFYEMDDATGDVTNMLDNRERHDEKLPLFVLVNAGSTLESRDGLGLLDIYDASWVVIDTDQPDDEIVEMTDVVVNPHLGDESADDVTSGALGADVAVHVNPDVRDDLLHLPAASYWEEIPETYRDLAVDAGYDEGGVTQLREAVALAAYYQTYEDKRELVSDLLFDESALAEHVSEQFRTRLQSELDTVDSNLEFREEDSLTFAVLDADAFTHRFDFPPTNLLLSALHREKRTGVDDELVTLGVDEDELFVRSDGRVDVRKVAEDVAEVVPEAGVHARGRTDGSIEFLSGERDAVMDAAVDSIASQLA